MAALLVWGEFGGIAAFGHKPTAYRRAGLLAIAF
jgi:hypothetical protein